MKRRTSALIERQFRDSPYCVYLRGDHTVHVICANGQKRKLTVTECVIGLLPDHEPLSEAQERQFRQLKTPRATWFQVLRARRRLQGRPKPKPVGSYAVNFGGDTFIPTR